MTIGELKKQIADINDDVRIDCIINIKDVEDDKYDIYAKFEIWRLDCANDDGYCEFVMFID